MLIACQKLCMQLQVRKFIFSLHLISLRIFHSVGVQVCAPIDFILSVMFLAHPIFEYERLVLLFCFMLYLKA